MTDGDLPTSEAGKDPEQLIADALRAKASQGPGAQTTPLRPAQPEPPKRLASGWILLLAVVLGLAVGTVIGLLTVL